MTGSSVTSEDFGQYMFRGGYDNEVAVVCLRCGVLFDIDHGAWNGADGFTPKDGNDVVEWMTEHNKTNRVDTGACA
jgi:hypothetical protein